MRIGSAPLHLTYSTIAHPAERWSEVRAVLDRHVLAVRNRVAPGRPFGLGLRLSGRAALDLDSPVAFAELQEWLERHDVYVFTINGSPYGRFFGPPVKRAAYRPDWLDEERIRYADRLAVLLAMLLPAGCRGTINTVAGAFRARVRSRVDDAAMAERMLRHVALLVRLADRSGKIVSLALEPEPACRLETIGETVEFFDRHLYGRRAVARLAALTGLGLTAAADAVRRHLGVCLDTGHVALEFEDPSMALRALGLAGIPVPKVQLGASIRVRNPFSRQARDALMALARDDALHPVVTRSGTRLRRWTDLPLALASPPADADEWRIHAHVPIALEPTGSVGSTQREVAELVASLGRVGSGGHVEVETTTRLPGQRPHDAVDVIARDLQWVMGHLDAVAKSA